MLFRSVPLLQDPGIQKAGLRHQRQIGTVQVPVPLDLRERQIMRLQRLDNKVCLRMYVRGRTVRSEGISTVVQIQRYGLRTAGGPTANPVDVSLG